MTKRYGDYFDDKTTLITGATSGIGRATTQLFGTQGARVICSDVNENSGLETLKTITDAGGNGIYVQADVTSRADIHNLGRHGLDKFGRIDFLQNSAGSAIKQSRTWNRSSLTPNTRFT